ncbi:MAG: molybdopterin molybdotransferase MoeA [Phycisphaerales bacterium]|nr:molybdopterin molybdotransferase MoeA [Phycisphaerales bacterium]
MPRTSTPAATRLSDADEVWRLLAGQVRPLPAEEIPVAEAHGRRLAEDALCTFDFPPFDRAVMDGFAVRSADFNQGHARLRMIDLVRAGGPRGGPLAPGHCARINTGAPLPPGADAVVMVERATEADSEFVELRDSATIGANIDRTGAILHRGAMVVPRGTRGTGGALAALASAGVTRVQAYRQPRVTLLTTGDELIDAGAPLGEGQIYDSNSMLLSAEIQQTGATLLQVGRCPDDQSALDAALRSGLAVDVLIVVGGMSRGTHDLVPRTLQELGVRWVVEGLNLKPGKPTRIGRAPAGAWVLGLPGNPVSAAVCFTLFGRPLLSGLSGGPCEAPPTLCASLTSPMPANGPRPMYQPARWSADSEGRLRAEPLTWRGSGDPFGLALGTALIARDANAQAAAAGDAVNLILIGGL